MEALIIIKQELDHLDKAIKAETTACASARRAAAHTQAVNERLRAQLSDETGRACDAEAECADLSGLLACLEQQAADRASRRAGLEVGGQRAVLSGTAAAANDAPAADKAATSTISSWYF
jgi:hypothetical protein